MLHSFLSFLHRGGAVAYYHVLPQRRSLWFDVDDIAPIDPANAKTNLYFGVHPCSSIPPANAHGEVTPPEYVRSQKRFVAAVNCLFAEFDTKDYGDHAAIMQHVNGLCVPSPSVLINSGGGVHAYWLLSDPYIIGSDDQRQAIETVQARWVSVVGGDPGAHDLCRVLRVPGSWNYKYAPVRPVTWMQCDLDRAYTLAALAAHIPPVVAAVARVRASGPRVDNIAAFNAAQDVGDTLEQRGYRWLGRFKMLSPYSSTGQAGVTVDSQDNRAFVHHGSDPLHDGYWKRPFDVVKILDYAGDFKQALAAVKAGRV